MQKVLLSKPNPPASYKARTRNDDVFDRFFTNSFITGALAVACLGGIWHAIHGPFQSVVPRALYALAALLLLLKLAWTALLQFIVGNTEGYSHDPTRSADGWSFRNWGKSQEFHPRDVANPTSLEELLQTVTTFGRAGRKLKAIGALHSWSACAVTEDVAVLTGQLNRVISIDKEKLTVTVEAGIRLQDLYAHLDAAGLALPTLPNVDVIHLGGALANATHGTNFSHGTMSSLIQAMQVVVFQPASKDPASVASGSAELVTLSKGDADPTRRRWLEGAVASFGSLGITYSVTLQCVEAYVSWVSERAFDYDKEVKGHIAEIARSYNSAQMVMWPVTGIVQTKVQVPMASRLVPTDSTNFFSNKELMQAKLIFFALQPSAKTFLWLRRMLAGLLHLLLKQSPAIAVFQTRKRAAVMHWTDAELVSRLSAALSTTPWINLEYAIPVERADEAATRLKALLCQYTGISVFAMRPVGADTIGYLSPTQGRPTVFFDVPFNRDLEAQGVYAKVEELLLSLGGRCSWSRLFKAPPSEVVKQYPRFGEFLKVKKEMDPFNVFSNRFSDGILFQQASS